MLRYILAVVVGYVVLAIIVMEGFSVAFVAPQFAFQRDSLEVTNIFMAYVLIVSLVAALVGGMVCKRISRCDRVVVIFAGIALAFGIFQAMANHKKPVPVLTGEQLATMSMRDKVEIARQPDWYSWTLPFVALGGIVAGGHLRK